MNPSALFTLILVLLISFLLVKEILRPDLIALILMVILGFSGIVSQKDVFSGFSSTAVMTILGISIISESLRQTGVSHWLSKNMSRFGKQNEGRLILAVMLTSACLSLFMNNIAVVGVIFPAVMTLSRDSRIPASRLLMPLAYGTTLGGMATLLTTSNIIVSGAIKEAGYLPFGLFDFFPIGIPALIIGTVYMLLFGRQILAAKTHPSADQPIFLLRTELQKRYDLEKNLHFLKVMPDCPWGGETILNGGWAGKTGLSIIGFYKGPKFIFAPRSGEMIMPGDRLLVLGSIEELNLADLGLEEIPLKDGSQFVANETTILAELVITPGASIVGKTLAEIHFREKYQLNVLAVWRNNQVVQEGLASLNLNSGDTLLVQGSASAIHILRNDPDLVLLKEDPDAVLNPRKFILSLAITFFTLGTASLGFLPIAPVILAGACLLLLTGCLKMPDVYRAVEWRSIFLIAGMWPLSIAIRSSGLADYAVGLLSLQAANFSFLAVSALLLILAFLLAQVMGGQVAPLVLAPLSITLAGAVGSDPRGLAMAVALGCSLTFATPYGHPVNLMVMGPGNYSLKDYFKVGFPLTLLAFFTILAGINIFWN